MIKTKPRVKKFDYILSFDQKDDDRLFYRIMNGIKRRYPKSFVDCNREDDIIDLTLYCTPKQYKNIVAVIRRNYGNPLHISRFAS